MPLRSKSLMARGKPSMKLFHSLKEENNENLRERKKVILVEQLLNALQLSVYIILIMSQRLGGDT